MCPIWEHGTSIWCKCLALRGVFNSKDGPCNKEDLFVLSWVRAVLAPLDATGIHRHILTRFGQHGDSSGRLSPVAPDLIFCAPWGNMT